MSKIFVTTSFPPFGRHFAYSMLNLNAELGEYRKTRKSEEKQLNSHQSSTAPKFH
jgi:hypothetical protein